MRIVFIVSTITAAVMVACGPRAADVAPTPAPESVRVALSPSETVSPPTILPTFTPTIVPAATSEAGLNTSLTSPTPIFSDLIFADGFEENSFAGWRTVHGSAPGLSVSPAAALIGTYGMQVMIPGTTALFVQDTLPELQSRYRARFYFDPNGVLMGQRHRFTIFRGLSGYTPVLQVDLRFKNGTYWLRARALDNGVQWHSSGWFAITNAAHPVEVDWQAATAGGRNGSLTFWLDGKKMDQRTRIANDTRGINVVRLGALGSVDATMSGTIYFDAFEARLETYIGP